MAAPKGNQFWKDRMKDGRDKDYTPESLLEASCNYFQWCEDNPWTEKDWVGKDAVMVKRETPRPFTLQGLCIFLNISDQTLNNYEKSEEYFGIVTRIKQIIYNQKFEGAAVGAYNANIIARDLGLSDKKEQNVTLKKIGKDLEDESYE